MAIKCVSQIDEVNQTVCVLVSFNDSLGDDPIQLRLLSQQPLGVAVVDVVACPARESAREQRRV